MKRRWLLLAAPAFLFSCAGTPSAPEVTPPNVAQTQAQDQKQGQSQAAQKDQPAEDTHLQKWSTFDSFGMKLEAMPSYEGVDEAEVVISSSQEILVFADLANTTTGEKPQYLEATQGGVQWTVHPFFPVTGDYELRVFAKLKSSSEESYYGAFSMTFKAVVSAAMKVYRWAAGDSTSSVRISDEKSFNDPWSTPAGSSWASYKKGTLAKDSALPVSGGSLRLDKGTPITFTDASGSLNCLSVPLSENLALKTADGPFTFKAGSDFYTDTWGVLAGTLATRINVKVNGNDLACSAGSRLAYRDGKLIRVTLAGESLFTVGQMKFPCTGEMSIYDYGDYNGFTFTTARDIDFKVGVTQVACPAGSVISYSRVHLESVLFSEDGKILINGKPQSVRAGWRIEFDDRGSLTDTYDTMAQGEK